MKNENTKTVMLSESNEVWHHCVTPQEWFSLTVFNLIQFNAFTVGEVENRTPPYPSILPQFVNNKNNPPFSEVFWCFLQLCCSFSCTSMRWVSSFQLQNSFNFGVPSKSSRNKTFPSGTYHTCSLFCVLITNNIPTSYFGHEGFSPERQKLY